MRWARGTLIVLLCGRFMSMPVFAMRMKAPLDPETPPAAELLDRYTRTLDRLSSLIVVADMTLTCEQHHITDVPASGDEGLPSRWVRHKRTQCRTDGERIHTREYVWGYVSRAHPSVPEARPHYRCLNHADGQLYRHTGVVGGHDAPGLVVLQPVASDGPCTVADRLHGYTGLGDERLDSILRRARRVSVSPEVETVGGVACHVIDAETDSGTMALWIDPAHGYHAARVQIRLGEGDRCWGQPLPRGVAVHSRFERTRWERVAGRWVPLELTVRTMILGEERRVTERCHIRRTEIRLYPDHDRLGSFADPLEHPENDPELRDGTVVQVCGDPEHYVWLDGQVVHVAGPASDGRLPAPELRDQDRD